MKNLFLKQFSTNIKLTCICFDRVIIRGYIRKLFFEAGIVLFLRAIGFKKLSNGVMRILTDQLNAHIEKEAKKHNMILKMISKNPTVHVAKKVMGHIFIIIYGEKTAVILKNQVKRATEFFLNHQFKLILPGSSK